MRGRIVIDRNLCKGCGYCITACPKRLITFENGFNAMGYPPVTQVEGNSCDGCGFCAIVCPEIAVCVYRDTKDSSA